jgi:hypothetical protein
VSVIAPVADPSPAARERIFFRLGENGAMGTDGLQWILYRRSARTDPHAPWQGFDWSPVSFVRSTKVVLVRCMREKALDLSAEGRTA